MVTEWWQNRAKEQLILFYRYQMVAVFPKTRYEDLIYLENECRQSDLVVTLAK